MPIRVLNFLRSGPEGVPLEQDGNHRERHIESITPS